MSFPGISAYNFGSGPGGPSRMGAGATRGRIQGSMMNGVNYPNPFFDVAHTYLPTTIKEMFKYCRYYFMTNGLINATVFKLAEYPITDLIIDHESGDVKRWWEDYCHNHLQIRPFQVETGLDYNCYGNSIVSISFPFQKHIICRHCQWSERADKVRSYWTFTNYGFRLTCPKCGQVDEAEAKDFYIKSASGIKLLRWNVEDIEISYNDISGETTYFYNIPGALRSDIVIGKKDVVEKVPQIFIQALRQQKGIVFNKDLLFHLKRPTLAWQDRGWGIPLILPVLKDAFYLQLMKKAQEAILLEHIVPLRVIFPQAASGTTDPFTTINLVDWKEQVATEIARWRYDNNYIPILPLPMGNQSIGGDGKALLLFQEMQMHQESIIMGLGVPREFLQGGLSWAGTNVSLRMLENAFIGYMLRQKLLINWVIRTIANYLELPEATARFKPFKMADDVQRKAYLFQLNQAQKVSDTSLLADADLNQEDEDELMIRELDKRLYSTRKQQLAMAEVQGESQLIMMKYQARAQAAQQQEMNNPPAPGEAGGPQGSMDQAGATQWGQQAQQQAAAGGMMAGATPPGGAPPGAQPPAQPGQEEAQGQVPAEAQSQIGMGSRLPQGGAGADLTMLAQGYAQQIATMPPQQQQQALMALQAQSPELAQMVQQLIAAQQQPGGEQGGPQVNMQPLPEQRAPRRAGATV